jgi:protein-S-isoprenylcysteine O-methyltransferase Ste14
MGVIIAQIAGVAAFIGTTAVLGVLLRGRREAAVAVSLSRVSHLAFWLGLAAPWPIGLFWPGVNELDRLVGLPPLPLALWIRIALGAPLLLAGMTLMQAAMSALRRQGKGAPAFQLTDTVASTGVYGRTRNPMALGWYAACIGGALLSGSTWMLLYSALGVVPVHLLNLKVFEELELSLRHGDDYQRYRETTPFLLPRFPSAER